VRNPATDQVIARVPLSTPQEVDRAVQAALRDPLTGLYNRAALDEVLEQEVARAHRYGTRLSMLIVDVDHFKDINDDFGHQAGDAVLKAVAALLSDVKRKSDLVFRYGGDEFVMVLPNTGLTGAVALASRIHQSVNTRGFVPALDLRGPTVSVGVATLQEEEQPGDFFHKADKALYRAKQRGRNGYCAEQKIPVGRPALRR
jgi:diguanylate cyclase (GGDEF)-like protein